MASLLLFSLTTSSHCYTAAPFCATFFPVHEKNVNTGLTARCSQGAASRWPPWFETVAFSVPALRGRMVSAQFSVVGRVGALARVRRFLDPVRQPDTVCHQHLTVLMAGFEPVAQGANHG